MRIITENLTRDGRVTLTGYVQDPSVEMKALAKKPAVLVCPGGAYLFTSDREAEPIALAYAARGFQAFVLRYSVGKDACGCKPLQEASDAIGLMRRHAEAWHLDPDRIASVGFSAGGHLAAWVGLCGEHKPNAMILGYPGLELWKPSDERGTSPLQRSLLGDDYTDEQANALNLANHVTKASIPMFCWHTVEDVIIPSQSVLRFALAYADNGVPYELHLFQQGEHGLSLGTYVTANGRKAMTDGAAAKWLDMSVDWLFRHFGEPEIVDKPYEMPDFLRGIL